MPQSNQYLYDSNMQLQTSIVISNGLFGESTHLPDVMHCETIAARSALHDWELAPHRHARLHQILLLQSGGGTAHIDGRIMPISPMTPVSYTHLVALHAVNASVLIQTIQNSNSGVQ